MQAVILAGGLGTRLSEETVLKPKPLVEIGTRPILWHIMKIYAHHGVTDFVVCCGYMGYKIKEYFANFLLHSSDVTIDLQDGRVQIHERQAEPWKVTLIDTGMETMTGGRIKRIAPYVQGDDFLLTYGDGVGDVDIRATIKFHQTHKRVATVTAAQPPGRFGSLEISNEHRVTHFYEKPKGDGGWINAGFFVLNKRVFDYIEGDESIWEQSPMRKLAADGELCAIRHEGFWQPMDTLRDKHHLEDLWASGKAPWKVWS